MSSQSKKLCLGTNLLSGLFKILNCANIEDFFLELTTLFDRYFAARLKSVAVINHQLHYTVRSYKKKIIFKEQPAEAETLKNYSGINFQAGQATVTVSTADYAVNFNLLLKKREHELFKRRTLFLETIAAATRLFFVNHELQLSSMRDDLTRAHNQNYLKKIIDNEIERNKRAFMPFSIIFMDVDNLKEINEKYSHLTGSALLKELAELLITNFRKSDLVARFGGDEFVIVLFNALEMQALKACQRIQKIINQHLFCQRENLNIKITASFGIAVYNSGFSSADEIIKAADLAMYQVKQKGRNGINLYRGAK